MYLILLISYAIAKSCSRYNEDYLKLVAHPNEYLSYRISNAFYQQLDYTQYELIDHNNKIQLNQPIQVLNSGIIDEVEQNYEIIKLDGVKGNEKYWLNQYAILRILNNQYQLLYNYKQSHSNVDRIPKFDKFIDIDSTDQIKCFDFVWMNSKSLIIDCMETINEGPKNYFYVIQIGNQILQKKIENTYPYSIDQNRNIHVQGKYLYRITKKNQYNNENQVEIFQINSNTLDITLFTIINSQFFIDNGFTEKYKDYQNLKILDFKSNDQNNEFSFLDDSQNIIFLEYNDNDDEWTLTTKQTIFKILTYDVDFDTYRYIGLGESFFYDSQYTTSKLTLSFDTSKYTPYLIHDFCNLVSSESLIQIVAITIKFTKLGDFSKVFIDQKYNELFSIQGNSILRFINYYDVFLIYNPIDNKDLNIYQAQVNYKGCTLNIEYQTIESDNQELIQVRKDEFIFWDPFYASSIYQYNYFNTIVQGPNISIVILDEKENISDTFNLLQSYKENVVDDLPKSNYIYMEIVEYNRSVINQLMIITQNDELKLTLQLCPLYQEKFKCSIIKEVKLDYQLTKQNTVVQSFYSFVSIVTLISSEKVSQLIYYSSNDFKTFEYTLDKEQQIDMIGFYSFILVLSSSKQQVVYVYTFFQDINLLYSFSSKDYEFIKPDKLFQQQQENDDYYTQQIFLFNKQDQLLIILSLEIKTHQVINQIQLHEVEDIKVLILKDKFVVVQQNKDKKYEILIYNMENKCNIILEKHLPLYSYPIENLNDIVLNHYLDILLIKSQNKLLVYLLNNPNHNSLFQEIIIDKNVKDIFGVRSFVIFIQKQEINIYKIQTSLAFGYNNIKMNQNTFIQFNQTLVQFSNDKNKLKINQKFKYVNKNTQIELYQDKLQIVNKLKNEAQDNFIQDMGTNWYSGQVIKFELLTQGGFNNITILQPINEIQHVFYNISRSVKNFDETKLFVLSDYTYSLIDKTNGKLIKEFQFLDKDYQCESILYYQDQNYIVHCSKGVQNMIFGISCKDQECQSSKGLSSNIPFTKVFLFEKNLFCIGQIYLYTYGIVESILDIDKAKLIGKIVLDYDYYSNTIMMIKSNHYDLYSFNFIGQLIIKELKILDNQLIKFNEFVIDMYEYLNQEYYMNNQLVEMKILQTTLEDDLFRGKFLFFAKKGAHFGLNMNFTCIDSGCQLKNQEVFTVIQGYEEYILFEKNIPTIHLQNDLLLILYQDDRSDQKFLASYRLPQIYEKNVPIKFFGAIQFTALFYRIEKQLLSYKLNNKEYILFNHYDYSKLTRYEVNSSPKIVYNGNMKTELEYIQVKNHYRKELLYFQIEIEKDTKSLVWLWITLGVIGGLFCIGVGIYVLKKKKKEDTLI